MLSSASSSSFLTCADTSGTQLKLTKTELHYEKIPRYGLLPESPTILAETQPEDRAQTKMASPALNMQSNYQTTQKFCISTKIFQTASFRLKWLVLVHQIHLKKRKKKLHSLLKSIKKPSELTTTENYTLLCLYIIWV